MTEFIIPYLVNTCDIKTGDKVFKSGLCKFCGKQPLKKVQVIWSA